MHKATRFNNHYKSEYDLHSDFAQIKSALADAGYDIKGRVGEILSHSVDDMKNKSISARDLLTDYVAEKPLKSLGIAVAAGIVLGFLFRK